MDYNFTTGRILNWTTFIYTGLLYQLQTVPLQIQKGSFTVLPLGKTRVHWEMWCSVEWNCKLLKRPNCLGQQHTFVPSLLALATSTHRFRLQVPSLINPITRHDSPSFTRTNESKEIGNYLTALNPCHSNSKLCQPVPGRKCFHRMRSTIFPKATLEQFSNSLHDCMSSKFWFVTLLSTS